MMPRVLFVNPNFEDYMSDGLFHGMRTLLGADAVDFPKAEYMYDTATAGVRERIRGGAFTLYGLLPDIPVERDHMLDRARKGEFDVVIFSDIWRTFGLWTEWAPQLRAAGVPLVVIDGSDRVEPYPFSIWFWRKRAWWCLPRAHNRARLNYKREISFWTRFFGSYMLAPPLARRLRLRPIAFSIPEEKIVTSPPEKDRDFPRQVVDPELARILGAEPGPCYQSESGYYEDLRRSRFGATTKRSGWDALRHYEIAAAGAVPCFRDLHRKPALCAPFGLGPHNSIAYADPRELLARIAGLSDADYAALQAGALAWARANATLVRARELLHACGLPAPASQPAAAGAASWTNPPS